MIIFSTIYQLIMVNKRNLNKMINMISCVTFGPCLPG